MKKYRDLSLVKKGMNIVRRVFDKVKHMIPDKTYLKLQYKYHLGKKLNLGNPETFNEKLQWLKLNDRKPEYTMYVDKYAVREHIKNSIGEEYLIPLIGVYDSVEDIDWDRLPNRFVLKCTHGSQCNIICSQKSTLDIEDSKRKLKNWMKKNWYWYGREWPYKNVKPRIICEDYLVQDDGDELRDYRFFCFNGEPKFIAVDFSITNKKKTRRNLYDLNWNRIDAEISYPKENNYIVEKPQKLKKMVELSKKLASNLRHARIDFYYIEGKIFFGEITLYHQSGYGKIRPAEFDKKMGEWLKLN